eukprot:scaffold19054_cov65-Phaeocystis_antarctica.AAC.2
MSDAGPEQAETPGKDGWDVPQTLLHGLCLDTAQPRETGVLGFRRRSRGQRRNPLIVRGRLPELRCRAKLRLPSTTRPAQHHSPHAVGYHIVRHRPHNPCRQGLEPLVVPPLRLGHLVALLLRQHLEGLCRGICPQLRPHSQALLGLEVPLRGLHQVPRVVEHVTEVEVRIGLVGPQGDGLAVGLACFAPVQLRGVPRALSQELRVLVARLRGNAGRLLRGLALPLLCRPTIRLQLPLLPHPLMKRPVQLPSARVRRTVDAAEVCRRQFLIAALIADGVLLTPVVHV